jgi:hypothetical protein
MLLLYVMSTGDNWKVYMFSMMDSSGHDKGPERSDASPHVIFSVAWMFVGSLVAMNLFVAVIVGEFTKIKADSEGTATMTKEQQQWVTVMRSASEMGSKKIPKVVQIPTHPVRRCLYFVVTSETFDMAMLVIIFLMIGAMAFDYWGIEEDYVAFYYYKKCFDYSAYFLYLEFVMKILGLGVEGYFSDGWHRFDFVIVCVAIVGSEGLSHGLPVNPTLLRAPRALRIFRMIRLLKYFKDLRSLLLTLIFSFPAMLNVCGVLSFVIFIYALLGLDLFTYVVHQDSINDDRNFDTLGKAGLLLFQVLTGDTWSGLMADAMVSEQLGHCNMEAGDCGSWVALPYFISFQIIGSFVLLNVIVAVILEAFTSISSQDIRIVQITDLEYFREMWSTFDLDGDSYISAMDMPDLLLKVPRPLGYKGFASRNKVVRICVGLKFKLHGGQVAFHEVLVALIRHNFNVVMSRDPAKFGGGDPEKMMEELKSHIPATATPPPPPPPPPPPRGAKFSPAEKFARNMHEGDASLVFALDVISKYTPKFRQWKKRALTADKSERRVNQRLNKARKTIDGLARDATPLLDASAAIELEAHHKTEESRPREPWSLPLCASGQDTHSFSDLTYIDRFARAAAASRTDSVKNEAEPREQWGGALHGSRNNWRGSHMDMF